MQLQCQAVAKSVADWPGLLVALPCYVPQSLGCWYEKYGVGIYLTGLLLLLLMTWIWELLWKDVGAHVNRMEMLWAAMQETANAWGLAIVKVYRQDLLFQLS